MSVFLENSGAMVELSIFPSFPCLSCVGYMLGLGKRDPVVKRRWLYTKSVNHQTGHRVDCRENHMLILVISLHFLSFSRRSIVHC